MDPKLYQEKQRRLHELASKAASMQQYIVSLDERRQSNRMASRAIDKEEAGKKLWLTSGDIFVRSTVGEAKESMRKDSQAVDEELAATRGELLRVQAAMEEETGRGGAHVVGSKLKGMKAEEVNSVLGNLPERSRE
eukprot:764061-Hanusia_phi.AAC.1